jgi:hypothetical protein
MKGIYSSFFLLLLLSVATTCLAFSTQDIVALKKAGFSEEIIFLMTKPTRSLQPKDIIELKKGGLSEDLIKAMILEDLVEKPSAKGVDERLVVGEIIKLKESGVKDETIQKMLDREERERARYCGIARTMKRGDGSEAIVYGDPRNVPLPDTRHYYINTSEYLKSLSLSVNSDNTLTPEEKGLWEQVFRGLRLRKDID